MDIYLKHNPTMDIADIVSARLSAWMSDDKSLNTIKKVEEKSGVGFGTIRRAKNGDGNITIEKLAAIAKAFKRHPSELLIDPDKAYASTPAAENQQTPSRLEANEPPPANIVAMPTALMTELLAIANTLNDAGLNRLIERARQIAEDHPKARLQKDA